MSTLVELERAAEDALIALCRDAHDGNGRKVLLLQGVTTPNPLLATVYDTERTRKSIAHFARFADPQFVFLNGSAVDPDTPANPKGELAWCDNMILLLEAHRALLRLQAYKVVHGAAATG